MNNKKYLKRVLTIICCILLMFTVSATAENKNKELDFNKSKNQIPVTAPMTTDLAGSTGILAMPSVFRVLCPSKNKGGTGFLHRSGWIITAAHVVYGCKASDLMIVGIKGNFKIKDISSNNSIDLALLNPNSQLKGKPLPISASSKYSIGLQVSTWGYPSGYHGIAPLLSSGYLSGIDSVKSSSGKYVKQWVVNAAFNSGNSGGPLVDIETGAVIGVVSSKLAPIPKYIESALDVLKKHKSGFGFKKEYPDGTTEHISQAQVIEMVLQHLRSQTQLVIGYAVMISDLRNFLKTNGIEP